MTPVEYGRTAADSKYMLLLLMVIVGGGLYGALV